VVGESGTLAASTDGGVHWAALTSPYQGSFFGAVRTGQGAVLAFGMRGTVLRSTDGGTSWSRIDSGTLSAFNNALALPDGRLALVGNGGLVALSDDDGRTLRRATATGRGDDLAQIALAGDGGVVLAGAGGVSHLASPAALGWRAAP
jgi:photosystem II stability/assembly factor-like uncharacterized protein